MLITGNRSLGRVLADKTRRFADRPFLISEDGGGRAVSWTWAQFDRDVNRAAHLLVTRGLRPGDKLNLHLGNRRASPAPRWARSRSTCSETRERRSLPPRSGARLLPRKDAT